MTEEQATYDLNGTAVLAARLNTMTVRMAELEERIDRLNVGQRELRERGSGDVLERIAVALETLAGTVGHWYMAGEFRPVIQSVSMQP